MARFKYQETISTLRKQLTFTEKLATNQQTRIQQLETTLEHTRIVFGKMLVPIMHHNGFTERDITIFKLRYGYKDGKTHNLETIAMEFGVTRERIRMLSEKTLLRLQCPDSITIPPLPSPLASL